MTSHGIYLREITENDLPQILVWHNDRKLYETLADQHRYVNIETEKQWFANYLKSRAHNLRLAICLNDSHQHIGNVYLLNINRVTNAADFHILIGEQPYRGQGYGYKALQLCLNHAFNDQHLHRINLHVLPENTAAINLYKKAGFITEGTLRQAAFKNGQYRDLLSMALLKAEWLTG